MIENIVQTLGGGSGIDTRELVNQLVEIQSSASATRLDTNQELVEAQISDFGLLQSAMSSLESAVSNLGNEDTFNAKSISIPDTSLISLTSLDAEAVPGNYKLEIDQVAQAQTLSSTTFSSEDDPIGLGELTIRLGDWNAGLDTFTVDPDATGATITIDETNNSLEGLRDAINSAGIGVQASIVSNSGTSTLLISGPSGASNELEIVATEDVSNPGLANFEFSELSQSLTQLQEGLDSQLTLNGLPISRSSNIIDDVIPGLKFDIFNASETEIINLSITEDKSFAENAVRDFVDAYNNFLATIEPLVDFDSELQAFGSLRNDPLAESMINSIRNYIGATIPGVSEGFSVLANIGIRTKLDGTLEINEDSNQVNTNFRAAFDQNFELVRQFFTPQYSSSDTRIEVNAFGNNTSAGSYSVNITQEATQGSFIASPLAIGFPIDTTGKDYSFTVELNGISADIILPNGVSYTTGDELAIEIQSLINLDQEIQNNGGSVVVSYNSGSGGLEFTSEKYGSKSLVSFTAVGADTAELGLAVAEGTAGLDVAGTVDGEEAFGFGNVLLPALGSNAEGLKLIIKPGATTATINFSRGFGSGFSNLINSFLASNGLIAQREVTLEGKLDDIEDDRVTLERRSEAYRLRLESQFIAMENIVRSLNNTGTFLDGIGDRLPFTAPR